MRSRSSITFERRAGRSVAIDIRSESPVALRAADDRVLITSSAAAPVGGDHLELDIAVDLGATGRLGSVAASLVQPDPALTPSTSSIRGVVRGGGHLDVRFEPTISIATSNHVATTMIDLAASATCTYIDELSLGRTREPSGTFQQTLIIRRNSTPLLHHSERFGPSTPGHGSSVSTGDARHVLTAVFVGVDASSPRTDNGPARGAWMPIADDAAVLMVVGSSRPAVLSIARTLAAGLLD